MFIPDYLFYRLATWFYKGDGPGGSRAVVAITLMYTTILCTFSYLLLCFLVGGTLAGGLWINDNVTFVKTYSISPIFIIGYLTHHRYQCRLETFVNRWGNDKPIQAFTKTVLVISVLFSVFIFSYQIVRYSQF